MSDKTLPLQILEDAMNNRLPVENGFIQVPTAVFVAKIDVGMPLPPALELFKKDESGKIVQLKSREQPYSPLVLSQWETVWIKIEDLKALQKTAEDRILSPSLLDSTEAPEKKAELLRATAIHVTEDLFKDPSPANIERSQRVVGSFVYAMMKDPKMYHFLSQLSSHDPYTLQHSVGTSVICIILARKLGITDSQDLSDVGQAGLLHDIGKIKINKDIINKNAPLDEFEWDEMRQHAEEGFKILEDNPQVSERAKRAVLQHHENHQGTGYPKGLKGDQIDLFAKIVCICDIYNALTTDRTYSKAKTPFEAFNYMRSNLSHKIDDAIFRELVKIYGGQI
ncbi:MAG: HD-GYP domain-containing protein [Bdellovibrionales bacterium]|nr:HD-GYP domain-containing protein [Bdellovibrionales bacterium]